MSRLARPAAVVVLLVALVAGLTPALKRVELLALDAHFDLRGTQPVAGLAVVAIDERTFSELDGVTWPFRRTLHARMLDRLSAAGARQIVYDVQFTEPSDRPDDDQALYEAVARAGHVILATGEIDERGRTRVLGGAESLAAAGGARAAASTFPNDADGAIRRFARSDTGLATIPALVARRLGTRLGAFPGGHALIDFRGPAGTIPSYSFVDVIDGRVGARELRGKTVIVGATAPALQDVHLTSAAGERQLPGAEIEANAIWTALHGNPLRELPGWLGALIAFALGALAPLLVRRLGPVRGSLVAGAIAAVYAVVTQLVFNAGLVLPLAVPLATLGGVLAVFVIARAAAEIAARARITRYSAELEAAVLARTQELAETQLEVVLRLARAAELHDDDTGEHIERMSRMCGEVALELGLSPARAELIRYAAVLHDVGKIGVPDDILRKPGRLSEAEMAIMRRHVVEGAELLQGSDSPLLQVAELIVRSHHERWDGSGYPNRIAGEEIPLEGRIAAVCDVFDALTHERPYKHAWTIEDACTMVAVSRGSHFDPVVADALLAVVKRQTGISPATVPA